MTQTAQSNPRQDTWTCTQCGTVNGYGGGGCAGCSYGHPRRPAQSSGHEYRPGAVDRCCECGWTCDFPNGGSIPPCAVQHAAHVASVAQAAQPASAAKPPEDGLEAQIIEAANEVIVHNGTAALTRSSIVKVFSKLIRTHQAARERELREKLEGLAAQLRERAVQSRERQAVYGALCMWLLTLNRTAWCVRNFGITWMQNFAPSSHPTGPRRRSAHETRCLAVLRDAESNELTFRDRIFDRMQSIGGRMRWYDWGLAIYLLMVAAVCTGLFGWAEDLCEWLRNRK